MMQIFQGLLLSLIGLLIFPNAFAEGCPKPENLSCSKTMFKAKTESGIVWQGEVDRCPLKKGKIIFVRAEGDVVEEDELRALKGPEAELQPHVYSTKCIYIYISDEGERALFLYPPDATQEYVLVDPSSKAHRFDNDEWICEKELDKCAFFKAVKNNGHTKQGD